jgi:hypothetical protein
VTCKITNRSKFNNNHLKLIYNFKRHIKNLCQLLFFFLLLLLFCFCFFCFFFFVFLFFFFFFQLLSINPTDSTSLTLGDKIVSLLPISKVATKNNISQAYNYGQGPTNSVVMVDMQIKKKKKTL